MENLIAAEIDRHEIDHDESITDLDGRTVTHAFCVCNKVYTTAHIARAVLAALTEAGAVEWGVRWSGDGSEHEPLHAPTLAGAQQVTEALAKITPAGGQQPTPVWRFVGPWTWAVE